jgi:HrpA-like RNA helicase
MNNQSEVTSANDPQDFIAEYGGKILNAVEDHDVTIVVAPTGVGKSSEIPQLLLEIAARVVVTQPRRIAAESLARYVAQKSGTTIGDMVGYKTALESVCEQDTRIIYCTDGIETLRQIHRAYVPDDTVFILDEVHEWSINIELLIAWFKHLKQSGRIFKLVLLSATIDAETLAEHFEDAAIVTCGNPRHEIEDVVHRGGPALAAEGMLRKGYNVLVFVPGKAEIRKMIDAITKTGVEAMCFPFHAAMSSSDIDWVFESYDVPKCIVATTIAQTSITIPDIDVVVDGGLERGSEFRDGIDGLYTRPVSLAEGSQRRGRVGRTKKGFYIDCCRTPAAEREVYSIPAIQRGDLSSMMLSLMAAGIETFELPYLHQPTQKQLQHATEVLQNLGFLDEEDRLTDMGRQAAKLPLKPRAARMLLEGVENGMADYNVITLATLFDEGRHLWFREEEGRKLFAGQYIEHGVSDVFDRIKTYDVAVTLPDHQLFEYGVEPTTIRRLCERRTILSVRLERLGIVESPPHQVLNARYVIAGLSDLVYIKSSVSNEYRAESGEGSPRSPHSGFETTSKRIVGLPWNFERHTRFGPVLDRRLLWPTVL